MPGNFGPYKKSSSSLNKNLIQILKNIMSSEIKVVPLGAGQGKKINK